MHRRCHGAAHPSVALPVPARARRVVAIVPMAAATKTTTKKATTQKATKKTATKKAATQKAATEPPSGAAAPKKPRIFGISFASVYPLYVEKAAKKGRTQD